MRTKLKLYEQPTHERAAIHIPPMDELNTKEKRRDPFALVKQAFTPKRIAGILGVLSTDRVMFKKWSDATVRGVEDFTEESYQQVREAQHETSL